MKIPPQKSELQPSAWSVTRYYCVVPLQHQRLSWDFLGKKIQYIWRDVGFGCTVLREWVMTMHFLTRLTCELTQDYSYPLSSFLRLRKSGKQEAGRP